MNHQVLCVTLLLLIFGCNNPNNIDENNQGKSKIELTQTQKDSIRNDLFDSLSFISTEKTLIQLGLPRIGKIRNEEIIFRVFIYSGYLNIYATILSIKNKEKALEIIRDDILNCSFYKENSKWKKELLIKNELTGDTLKCCYLGSETFQIDSRKSNGIRTMINDLSLCKTPKKMPSRDVIVMHAEEFIIEDYSKEENCFRLRKDGYEIEENLFNLIKWLRFLTTPEQK